MAVITCYVIQVLRSEVTALPMGSMRADEAATPGLKLGISGLRAW